MEADEVQARAWYQRSPGEDPQQVAELHIGVLLVDDDIRLQ